MSKGEAAVTDIVRTPGSEASRFEVWPLDLSNFESVKAFGERVQRLRRLDVVVQNAGILTGHWKVVEHRCCQFSRDGAARVFGTAEVEGE